jgi:hypothetical protein
MAYHHFNSVWDDRADLRSASVALSVRRLAGDHKTTIWQLAPRVQRPRRRMKSEEEIRALVARVAPVFGPDGRTVTNG